MRQTTSQTKSNSTIEDSSQKQEQKQDVQQELPRKAVYSTSDWIRYETSDAAA